ncbi:hypothetical protein HK405_007100 [Cladochytrium tenue]|nr:hypothetical protein HK405_007100 [Cladochytrium tenue]
MPAAEFAPRIQRLNTAVGKIKRLEDWSTTFNVSAVLILIVGLALFLALFFGLPSQSRVAPLVIVGVAVIMAVGSCLFAAFRESDKVRYVLMKFTRSWSARDRAEGRNLEWNIAAHPVQSYWTPALWFKPTRGLWAVEALDPALARYQIQMASDRFKPEYFGKKDGKQRQHLEGQLIVFPLKVLIKVPLMHPTSASGSRGAAAPAIARANAAEANAAAHSLPHSASAKEVDAGTGSGSAVDVDADADADVDADADADADVSEDGEEDVDVGDEDVEVDDDSVVAPTISMAGLAGSSGPPPPGELAAAVSGSVAGGDVAPDGSQAAALPQAAATWPAPRSPRKRARKAKGRSNKRRTAKKVRHEGTGNSSTMGFVGFGAFAAAGADSAPGGGGGEDELLGREEGLGTDDDMGGPVDLEGEEKVDLDGALLGGRQYRIRAFSLPRHANRLYMLTMDLAKILGLRDSHFFYVKNPGIRRVLASQEDKESLLAREMLAPSLRSRPLGIMTARSAFKIFGHRIVLGGRPVRDDYFCSGKTEQTGPMGPPDTIMAVGAYVKLEGRHDDTGVEFSGSTSGGTWSLARAAVYGTSGGSGGMGAGNANGGGGSGVGGVPRPSKAVLLQRSAALASDYNIILAYQRRDKRFADVHTGVEQLPQLTQPAGVRIERSMAPTPLVGLDRFAMIVDTLSEPEDDYEEDDEDAEEGLGGEAEDGLGADGGGGRERRKPRVWRTLDHGAASFATGRATPARIGRWFRKAQILTLSTGRAMHSRHTFPRRVQQCFHPRQWGPPGL